MATSRSAKVLILSSGQALTGVVALVSAAALTRLLSRLDFATYRQTMLAYSFAVPFVMLGLHNALFYFLPREDRHPRRVLVENLMLLFGAGLFLSLFILLGGNHLLARRFNNPGLAAGLLLFAPYPLLMLPAMGMNGCLMARERTGQIAVFNVASRFFMLLCVVVPCLFWATPNTAIVGNVAGAAVTSAVAICLMFAACGGGQWRPTWSGLGRQIAFSVPLGLANLTGTVNQSLDQVMVSAFCPPEDFAVYSVGAIEIPLIAIITGSMTSVLLVDYARLHYEHRTDAIVALIHRAMIKSATVLLPAMALLFCIAPELMRLLFGAGYGPAAGPFRVYLLLLPIRTITFGAVLQATGRSRDVLIGAVIGLTCNAALSWPLIRHFGPVGAACSSIIATWVFVVPYLAWSIRRVLGCPLWRLFPWRNLGGMTAVSVLSGVPIIFVKRLLGARPDILVFALAGIAFVVVALPLFAAFGWLRPAAVVRSLLLRLGGKSDLDIGAGRTVQPVAEIGET
jgi:O-antigen/teichoic acid export membrane protein